MKKLVVLFSLLVMTIVSSVACEIKLSVQEKSQKEVYKAGDEVVIDVEVRLIHRNCHLDIKETKFTYDNLKILGATDWKETSPGVYTRQVKAKITNDKGGDSKLTINRKCDREGGHATCILKQA